MKTVLVVICLVFTTSVLAEDKEKQNNLHQATEVVKASLGVNEFKVTESDLRAIKNRKGGGVFVYVPKTRFKGVERFILWMVIDGNAYALNGATKNITPDLPWPRKAPEKTWDKTGLDKYMATEAIKLVFGKS